MRAVVVTCIKVTQLEADIKRLGKKFPSVELDLLYAQRLLEARKSLPQTYQYPRFGNRRIYKTRVINTSLADKGKSSGYRLIYEETNGEANKVIVLIMLYAKNEYRDENKVKNEIRFRLNDPSYPVLKH